MARSRRYRIILSLLVGLIGLIANSIPAVLAVEEGAPLDWLFRVRGPIPAPAEVVVISIDSESANSLGLHRDPNQWPRSLHGELVKRLNSAGASVIVFDLIFDRPRDPIEDAAFADAVKAAKNVILLERLHLDSVTMGPAGGEVRIETRTPPIPSLRDGSLATAPFPLPLEPVKVSQFWAYGPSDPEVPTLATIAVHGYLLDIYDRFIELLHEVRPDMQLTLVHRQDIDGGAALSAQAALIRGLFRQDPSLARDLLTRLEQFALTTDRASVDTANKLTALISTASGSNSRYLNFFGPVHRITTIPYSSIVGDSWDASDFDLAGKAVFVGFSERTPTDQQDSFYTAFSEGTGTRMSGVEIGATGFANLLTRASIRPLPTSGRHLLMLIWGTLFAALLLWLPIRVALMTGAIAASAYVFTAARLFETADLWVPLLVPMLIQLPAALLVMFAWRFLHAQTQRDKARRTLGLYLPPQVVDEMSRDTGEGRPRPQLLHGTCLVTDAAQYTSLSERLAPEELHRLLNDYYAVMFAEVEKFGGFVTDVVGDSMVAVWSSTEPDSRARSHACQAANAVLDSVAAFNSERAGLALPTRIGVHSGQILLGDIGAESHFEYRAVGDIVNTATRIQGLNKRLRTNLLISDDVLVGTDFLSSRCVGDFQLAGKTIAIRLHDKVSFSEQIEPGDQELTHLFGSALQCFRDRDWQRAMVRFRSILNRFPADGPSQFYRDLCQVYMVADPGPGWQGTIVVTDK